MKYDKARKIILILLSVVLCFLLIDNFKSLRSGGSYWRDGFGSKPNGHEKYENNGVIAYIRPKHNPFIPSTAQKKRIAQDSPGDRDAVIHLEKVSKQYRIDGIVLESKNAQVILKDLDGHGVLVASGDSLGGWRLMNIAPQTAVFRHNRMDDTLYLY